MKRLLIITMIFTSFILFYTCDKPDALKEEAYLLIENTSYSYEITGVYYANTGFGSNKISSSIGPGENKTFKLSAEDDYVYNIMVTSNNPNALEYSNEDVHFYDERRITVQLTESEWLDHYPW